MRIFDDLYVCPYLSPECGDRGVKNLGCDFGGKVCWTPDKEVDEKPTCERCDDTGWVFIPVDMDGSPRNVECNCKK